MSTWTSTITAFHEQSAEGGGPDLLCGAPAPEGALAALADNLSCVFPSEFCELYAEVNGFGAKTEEELTWFFLPLDRIATHTESVREEFRDTHPELATRFVAFIDWGNGDACGYLLDGEGVPLEGIYLFEHEAYEFADEQAADDFVYRIDDSIDAFLTE